MTQKALLTYALHGVEEKLKIMCEIVANGAVSDRNIGEILTLINERSEIKYNLRKEEEQE